MAVGGHAAGSHGVNQLRARQLVRTLTSLQLADIQPRLRQLTRKNCYSMAACAPPRSPNESFAMAVKRRLLFCSKHASMPSRSYARLSLAYKS
jgi:hypothetical protein